MRDEYGIIKQYNTFVKPAYFRFILDTKLNADMIYNDITEVNLELVLNKALSYIYFLLNNTVWLYI